MILRNLKIVFIGGGNMASAIIGGLIKQGAQAKHISVADPSIDCQTRLRENFGIETHPNIDSMTNALSQAHVAVLAVKPQQFKEVARAYAALQLVSQPLLFSVAAGIKTTDISRWTNNAKVIRAMPNTPALINQGMTGLFASASSNHEERAIAEMICQAMGSHVWVEHEELMDSITAVSGSGPAYFFAFIEAIEKAGVSQGLDAASARKLSIQTALGAAMLAQQSTDSPSVLREKVTSKGGTTYAALQVFEKMDLQGIVSEALEAARARGAEMGEELGRD